MPPEAATADTTTAPPVASRGGADRASIVAELAAERARPGQDVETTPAAEPPTLVDVAVDELDAAVEPIEAAAEPAEDEPEKEAPPDPAASKAIAAAQKAERRHKEQVAKDRAEIDAARKHIETEWRSRVEAAEAFESLKGKGMRGFVEAAAMFGIRPEDARAAARAVDAMSPESAKDPRNKAAAEQTIREREWEARVAAAEKLSADTAKAWEAHRTEQATRAQVDKYMAGVEKAVDADAAPLVARMLAKNPDKARARFLAVATSMAEEDGATPTAADVVAEVERRRRAELEDEGIDPGAILRHVAAPPVADKKPPGKTLARAGGAPAAPKKALTAAEERADFILRRDAGKWDD